MKSLQNNRYIYRKAASGIVTWELRNHGLPIFKGRNYTIDGYVEVDVYNLFIKDYYAINVSEILRKIQIGGIQYIATELLDLDIVWYPNIPSQEEIIHINVDYPEESEILTIESNTPHQVILFSKNINQNNYIVDIEGDVKLPVITTGLYPVRLIVIADRYDIGNHGELIISNRTTGQPIERYNVYDIVDSCDKANMYLITDTINFYSVTSGDITYTNEKSSIKNILGYNITYDVKEGMTLPVILNENYTKELYEKINNNFGVIITVDDDVNYGIIDTNSIKTEKHKQSFTVKI